MSTMQFDESQFKIRSRRILGEPEVPGMIRVLVTKGIVKTERQAIGVLLSGVCVIIAVSIFIIRSNSVGPAVPDPEYLTLSQAKSN